MFVTNRGGGAFFSINGTIVTYIVRGRDLNISREWVCTDPCKDEKDQQTWWWGQMFQLSLCWLRMAALRGCVLDHLVFVVILSLYMLLVSWKSWSCTQCVAEPFYDEPASASTVSLTFTVYGTGTGSTVYTELE